MENKHLNKIKEFMNKYSLRTISYRNLEDPSKLYIIEVYVNDKLQKIYNSLDFPDTKEVVEFLSEKFSGVDGLGRSHYVDVDYFIDTFKDHNKTLAFVVSLYAIVLDMETMAEFMKYFYRYLKDRTAAEKFIFFKNVRNLGIEQKENNVYIYTPFEVLYEGIINESESVEDKSLVKTWVVIRDGLSDGHCLKHPPSYVHFSRESAMRELKRLTRENPGITFRLYESVMSYSVRVVEDTREA